MGWKGGSGNRVDKGVKRRPLPRRPRAYKLRQASSGGAHLTISAWLLEAVGLSPGDSVTIEPVESVVGDAKSAGQLTVAHADPAKRQPLTDSATRWRERDAWSLVPYGKRVDANGEPVTGTSAAAAKKGSR